MSVKPCLSVDDVTLIIKCSTYKIDKLPENKLYLGQSGALDRDQIAYAAVQHAGTNYLQDVTYNANKTNIFEIFEISGDLL